METCTDCGQKLNPESDFCPSCGVIQIYKSFSDPNYKPDLTVRKCLECGYSGKMRTWMDDSFFPKLAALAGFCFGIIPGVLFIGFAWGKRQCPRCRSLKNMRNY